MALGKKEQKVQALAKLAEIELTCVSCQHMYFEGGSRGYSTLTPGYAATLECSKRHWEMELYTDDRLAYRNKILSAGTCDDLELRDEEE